MAMNYAKATLAELRKDVISYDYKGMPIAGTIYWSACTILMLLRPEPNSIWYIAITSGLIFPLGVIITRLRGGDLFKDGQDNPLTAAFVMGLVTTLLFFPLVMVAAKHEPLLFLVGLSLISGNIWIIWGWTAGSNLGLRHAIGRAVGCYLAYFYMPEPYTGAAICAIVVLAYGYSFYRFRELADTV
jgi:hypothetical protein